MNDQMNNQMKGQITVLERLDRQPIRHHITIGFLFTLVLGYFDYRTGLDFRMEIFYLAPIFYVTWFAGKRAGIAFSAISLGTILCSDIMAGKNYDMLPLEIWNSAMYFSFYVITTLLLSGLRTALRLRADLIAELQRALRDVKELRGILPICASCKKIRDDDGYWHDVAVYIRDHTHAEFTHGICQECAERLYPDYFKKNKE
jgi:hypothetical protein